MKKFLIFISVFVSFLLFNGSKVSAYTDTCNAGEIYSVSGTYKLCGSNNIYLMENNKELSSFLVATRGVSNRDGKVIYAGKVGGIDTFYSSGFNFYGVVYDDKGLFTSSNNVWSDVSINGIVVYSGEFEDNALLDESREGFIEYYDEVGTYLIRQYIGGKVQSAIKVIVVDRNAVEVNVEDAKFGDDLLEDINLPYSQSDLSFKFSGGTYGFGQKVSLSVNSCKITVPFRNVLVVDYDLFGACLLPNEFNTVSLTAYNGFNNDKTFKYLFNLRSSNVSIKLEASFSDVVTTSKRILITANAGNNAVLDEDYCLYYWSKSANDGLTYNEFMTNYELSEHKGMYSSNKGVILRDSSGTYYLYALAKDDNSTVVVRSDKYEFKKSKRVNKVIWQDFALVGTFCFFAAIPIFVYLFIREKDTI